MAWTLQDSILSDADSLRHVAIALRSEGEKWSPLAPGSPHEEFTTELHARRGYLWYCTVRAGFLLLSLARNKALVIHPRLETVIFQQWSELRKHAHDGDVPFIHRMGVPSKSFDWFLVKATEDVCRLWRGKHQWIGQRYGEDSEFAFALASVLDEIADDITTRYTTTDQTV